MARPIQTGLTYFPLDTGLFSDRKTKKLLHTFGGKGLMIYLFVLCEIYKDKGYFVRCDDGFITDVSIALNLSESIVSEVITFCVSNVLFNKRVFDVERVLTSHGIQQRYLGAKARSNVQINAQYLVTEAETPIIAAITKSPNNVAKTTINSAITQVNAVTTPINTAIIPHKEKKSKIEEEEKEEENFSPPPPSPSSFPIIDSPPLPFSSQQLTSVDTLIDSFKNEQMFVEYAQMSYKLSKDEVLNYLDSFKNFLHAMDEHQKRRKDCKTHFLNWLSINVAKDRKAKSEEPQKTEEPSEEQLSKIAKLYPQNNAYMVKVYRSYTKEHNLTPEKALEHFERAYQNHQSYGIVLLHAQNDKQLLFKDL